MPICLTKGRLFSKVVTVNAKLCLLVTLLGSIDEKFLHLVKHLFCMLSF